MSLPDLNQTIQDMSGVLYLREYDSTNSSMFSVGCWDNPNFAGTETEKSIPNRLTPEGGKCVTSETLESLVFSFDMFNFDPKLLALVWKGTYKEDTLGTGTSVEYTVSKNSFLPLPGVIDTVSAVTGTGGTPTYVEGTDYFVNNSGITIPSTGDIAAGDSGSGVLIEVSYTTKISIIIEALTEFDKEFTARFLGTDKQNNNNQEFIDLHRIKFKMPNPIPIVETDNFKMVTMQAEVLPDRNIDSTGGYSQHLRVVRDKPA